MLDAYPDVVAAGGACCDLFSLSSRVWIAVCRKGGCRSTVPLRTMSQRR